MATDISDTPVASTSQSVGLSPQPSCAASSSSSSGTSSLHSSSSSSSSGKASANTASTSTNGENNDIEGEDSRSDAGSATGTADTKTLKSKGKIDVLVDTPGFRKELRTSEKGKRYLLETRGLWTTLRSLDPVRNAPSVRKRMVKRMTEFATFWPFLIRFASEVVGLGRWRFLLHLVASTLTGLTPALRIYLSGKLIAIAQAASEQRILRKKELVLTALASYLSSFFETWIDSLLADNNGILQRRFQAMVSEHLISARARLDVATLNKSRVIRDFSSASSLVHALGDGTFVIGQLIDLFTAAVSLTTQGSMLYKMTTKDNADLALISVFSATLTLLRWFVRGNNGYAMTSITDPNYNRMNLMEYMSYPDPGTFGERKVLGLGDWVHTQFKKASNALGDVSLAAPRSFDPFFTATEAVRSFTDTGSIVLFAIKAAEKPLGEATLSMSALTFIQGAARNLAGSLYRFVYDVQHFGEELSAFKSYYRVLEIKSQIVEPEEPRVYETMRRTVPRKLTAKESEASGVPVEEIRTGMEVEFKDVSYSWPGRKEKALDGISFKIQAGELTAIVGYNGAGKSTIIALIARLCDPNSGEILINGHDIKSYKTSQLHKAMSFLFQSSADLPLTIQEYIGVGNLDEIHNLERIRKAATDSGAVEFIDKLEDGFQSSFTGQTENETADTMYRDAVSWDKYLESDSDTDTDSDSDSDSDKDEDEKEALDDEETNDSKRTKRQKKRAKRKAKQTEGDQADKDKDGSACKNKDEEDDDNSDASSDTSSSSYVSNTDSEGRLAFSGGQRQKLILARSFLRDQCDLALFDEYSANLDPLAEHQLFTRITANRGKQTLLYITHRYSTVRHADHILMLEKGKVVESGTHEELMAIENGKYAEMSRLALGEIEVDKDKSVTSDEAVTKAKAELASAQEEAIKTSLPLSRPASPQLDS